MKWKLIIVVMLIVGVACFFLFGSKGLPVRVSLAENGDIKEYVDERAKTTLPRIYCVTMPLNGRVEPIRLRAGTVVGKGQVVARMSPADLQTDLAVALARVSIVKARIMLNEFNKIESTAKVESVKWISAMSQMVEASEQKIKANKDSATYAQEYAKALVDSGQAISKIEKSKAKTDSATADVDYQSARTMNKAIVVLKTIFELAPTYIQEWLERKSLSGEVLKKELAEAEANLAKVKRDVGRGKMKSSINGVVLRRHVKNERFLSAGAPLLDLGDLNQLEVTVNVLSQEVMNIRPGNAVDINGVGSRTMHGLVKQVKPKGFTKISSLGVEQQRVPVIVSINPQDIAALKRNGSVLGVDFRVRTRIFTAGKENVLKIPRPALFRGSNGNWQVFKVVSGKALITDIEIGLINDREAEVVKGLNQNDQVVIAPPADLKNGQKVDPEKI